MSSDTDTLQTLIDQLEQILSQLDSFDAKIAAIHVDIAIAELCRDAHVPRPNGMMKGDEILWKKQLIN